MEGQIRILPVITPPPSDWYYQLGTGEIYSGVGSSDSFPHRGWYSESNPSTLTIITVQGEFVVERIRSGQLHRELLKPGVLVHPISPSVSTSVWQWGLVFLLLLIVLAVVGWTFRSPNSCYYSGNFEFR